MRLGGAVQCKSGDPDQWVRAHRAAGYNAAYCPQIAIEVRSLVSPVRAAFEKADIVIAEVGSWSNLLDPDEEKRKAAFELTCDRLALADEIGALCCVNTPGSHHPEIFWGPHRDNFTRDMLDASVEMARRIVDTVKPRSAKMTFEMVYTTWLDTPENVLEFTRAVDRTSVAVHLDPVNLVLSPRLYYDIADLLNRCFHLLGPFIASCHAKDIHFVLPSRAVHFDECMPGEGAMDYDKFLTGIDRLDRDIPLMIEHLSSPEEYRTAAEYIRSVGRQVGISLPEPLEK